MSMNTVTRVEEHNDQIYIKIDSDNHDKIEEAVESVIGDPFYDSDEPKRPKYLLRQFFDNHADFYDSIGFNSSTEHGGTGKNFDAGGFRKFVRQFFDTESSRLKYLDPEQDADKLQLVCDAVAERVGRVIQAYEDGDTDSVVATSNIRLDSGESEELNDPDVLQEALLVTDDSAHKIEVSEVEDVDNLGDISDEITEQTKSVYETQVNARVGSLKNRIQTLEQKLEDERQEMMVKGIKLVDEMEDWEVRDGRLVYTKELHPKTVTKKYESDDTVYELTEEAQEKFYIKGLQMRIQKEVRKLYYDEAFHPHALSTKVCSGGFKAPLEEALETAVEQMRHIDLHSGSHTEAERELKDNFEEYTKTDGENENLEVFTAQ